MPINASSNRVDTFVVVAAETESVITGEACVDTKQ